MALLVLSALTISARTLEESGDFSVYALLLMGVCFFYIFADVAGDGMTIELTKLEPEATRGYILTTGQMIRFLAMTLSSFVGTFFMNGRSYYNASKLSGNDTVFSYELSFWQVHLLLLCVCVPVLIAMAVLLRDPPRHA